ncbi:serine hydrolase, partial [Promicromonospora citrea]|nr:serine hydrolase [Promicromonospora citrea]
LLGLGADAVVRVPTDARHRLDPAALARVADDARAAGDVVAAVVATVGWVFLIGAVMSLQPVPQEAARVTQVLQGIGVLGLVPAAAQVVSAVRGRRGWRRVLGALLVLLALGALAWLAVELRLLAPSVSY